MRRHRSSPQPVSPEASEITFFSPPSAAARDKLEQLWGNIDMRNGLIRVLYTSVLEAHETLEDVELEGGSPFPASKVAAQIHGLCRLKDCDGTFVLGVRAFWKTSSWVRKKPHLLGRKMRT